MKPIILDNANRWYITDMELSDKGVLGDAHEAYCDVLHNVNSTIVESV